MSGLARCDREQDSFRKFICREIDSALWVLPWRKPTGLSRRTAYLRARSSTRCDCWGCNGWQRMELGGEMRKCFLRSDGEGTADPFRRAGLSWPTRRRSMLRSYALVRRECSGSQIGAGCPGRSQSHNLSRSKNTLTVSGVSSNSAIDSNTRATPNVIGFAARMATR